MADGQVAHEHEAAWTEESWREFSDYADQVNVRVRFVEWVGAEDAEELWLIRSYGAAWPRDWLTRQLGEIASRGGGGCCGTGNFVLDVRESHQEWGASGGFLEATLTLAQDQLSNATWALLGALAQGMRQRLSEKRAEWGGDGAEEALVDEAVRAEAVHAVAGLCNLAFDDLTVRSVELTAADRATVELGDRAGVRYLVDVHDQRGVMVARVRKITNPD